jgi:FtsH-binding integral membrane protein
MLTAIITFNIGPARRQQRGPYRVFPGDTAHWFGWMGFLFFAGSASYSAFKRGFPRNIKTWLLIHCVVGTLSLILVAFHIINKLQALRPGYFISFFAFFLMAVIVIGGILGRYVKAKIIRDYWRTLHVPLTIIFCLTLAFHILEKMNILW